MSSLIGHCHGEKTHFSRNEKEPFNILMSMKNKQKTNLFAGYKYLLFVPLAFALMFMNSCKRKPKVQKQEMEGTRVVVKAESPEDTAQIKNVESTEKTFEVVEQMPAFPGGDAALMKYLSENIKYPKAAEKAGEQGRVVVNFIVEKDGAISNVNVVRSVTPTLDAEAVRVIKAMPKWVPGKQDGQFVRVKYNVPVSFRLQ